MIDDPELQTLAEATSLPATTTPDQLLTLAVDKNLDIDKLEKLMAMKERWEAQQAKRAFNIALSAFQKECPDLRKNKTVSFTTKDGRLTEYNYAPLSDIDRQIKSLLNKHGLSKNWKISETEAKIKVTCVIKHIDGHEEEGAEMESEADTSGGKNAIQGKGSSIEYMKRYTLIGALGLSTADQDIDGRMPELDIDKLHKNYMGLYNQIILKDSSFISPGDPDNWQADRTPDLYIKAIGKARKLLTELTRRR
jgi:hypothetical protein